MIHHATASLLNRLSVSPVLVHKVPFCHGLVWLAILCTELFFFTVWFLRSDFPAVLQVTLGVLLADALVEGVTQVVNGFACSDWILSFLPLLRVRLVLHKRLSARFESAVTFFDEYFFGLLGLTASVAVPSRPASHFWASLSSVSPEPQLTGSALLTSGTISMATAASTARISTASVGLASVWASLSASLA